MGKFVSVKKKKRFKKPLIALTDCYATRGQWSQHGATTRRRCTCVHLDCQYLPPFSFCSMLVFVSLQCLFDMTLLIRLSLLGASSSLLSFFFEWLPLRGKHSERISHSQKKRNCSFACNCFKWNGNSVISLRNDCNDNMWLYAFLIDYDYAGCFRWWCRCKWN